MTKLAMEDFGRITEGAKLAGFLPYLEEEIYKMEQLLEDQVFKKLAAKALTPEMALEAWIEKVAYRRLLKRFNQTVRMGTSIAEQHQEDLSGTS
jgi:hypothetical protein